MVDRLRATILLVSLLATFVVMRLALAISPDSDFDVAGYNIHHLFPGLVLITIGAIPLAIMPGRSRRLELATAALGCGLGLALDEWVYLIATDGSNASYLLPVSFWGGVIMVGLACCYVAVLLRTRRGGGGGEDS